jgi:hypothetical protein
MRLHFLLEKQGETGDLPCAGRKFVFLVDPVKVPTVSALTDFLTRKLNIQPSSRISLFLGDSLVDNDESIAIFNYNEVVTVK